MSQTPNQPKKVSRQDMALIAESARIRSWELITSDPLAVVLAPGYFDPMCTVLDVLDRLDVTCGYQSDQVETALLVVTGIILNEPKQVFGDTQHLPPEKRIPGVERKVRRVRAIDYSPERTLGPERQRRLGVPFGVLVAPHGTMTAAPPIAVEAAA
ncbi:MAG TPA: hypothetical protein PKA13_21505 [Geminicoccaceae bacterium]|nr:hypothetical protein [Geminicoccus sp.]HMU52371.1 hypothetical protein [Geminicoccaceae bacterium]